MDDQITKAKEQALSRREILDKVEKERFASEEESWLDDYEMHTISVSLIKSLQRSKQQRGFFHVGDELHLRFKIGWNGGRRWFF
ncbi:hypothetical protein AAC387_Pa05g1582 [Persea americana]